MKQAEFQISLFDGDHKLTINKPIRLIELFAGYGSQALALKYLGVNFEHWKICEWAVKSIQAYKDVHFDDDNTDYSETKTQDEIINYLYSKGISANYNEPMTIEQIKRLGEQKQRTIYNNIVATHNLVSVCNCHASDLDISDTDKYTYIMTYSFPCQDLSAAGKKLGMAKGSGTRSGLLWEVERILDECNGKLPQILLMENVPDVIGAKNSEHFAKWLQKLDSLGYKSKWEILNAKDYGVPQNRERCFMVSWLGNCYYDFPQKQKLKLRLKDMLETKVDEKYYLSQKGIEYFDKKRDRMVDKTTTDEEPKLIQAPHGQYNGEINDANILPTLCTVSITNWHYTLQERQEPKCIQQGTLSGGKWDKMLDCNKRYYNVNGISNTITTCGGGNTEPKIAEPNRFYEQGYAIRKLTPRECFRLMGVKDEDFDKVEKNQSNSSLYHLAGDSIVVDVLMAIFGQML